MNTSAINAPERGSGVATSCAVPDAESGTVGSVFSKPSSVSVT